MQRKVLDAAFALLDCPSVPVLVDFPERIVDEVDSPLACAVRRATTPGCIR
jgi:hypothetical protein